MFNFGLKGENGFCGCVDGPKGDKGKITAYFFSKK